MIRNDSEYQDALRRLEGGRKSLAEHQARLVTEGLTAEQIEYAIQPSHAFALQVAEEVAQYERTKRGRLDPLVNLHGLGPMLIAARVAANVTQRQLAELLEVHESQISRDERNEYHGVTVERASRILDVLGVTLTSAFGRKPAQRRNAARDHVTEASEGPAPARRSRPEAEAAGSVARKSKKSKGKVTRSPAGR